MEYSTQYIHKKAKELVKEHKLIFIEDICAYMGISKETYYRYLPIGSNENDELKLMLGENKINIKVGLRKKWEVGDNATLQMALYKLTSTPIEHKKLQQNYTDITTNKKALSINDDKTLLTCIKAVEAIKEDMLEAKEKEDNDNA